MSKRGASVVWFLPLACLPAACAATPPRPPAASASTAEAPTGAPHHAGGHHGRFDDPAHWAAVFDAPDRDAWQQPDAVLRALGLAPDARVADVGAGTGYFSVRLARAVPQGRVWAADIEPGMVRHLRHRAEVERLANLYAVLATTDDPMIPERVDVVLVVDTNHHIDERVGYYRRLVAALRPGGRVVIVDYTLDAAEGPPIAMRLAPSQVDAEMTAAGYARDGDAVLLPRQYVLTYRPRVAANP